MTRTGKRNGAYRGTTPEMRAVIAWAEATGWFVEVTRGCHLRFRKEGRPPVFAALTGSARGARNTQATLRRSDLAPANDSRAA
jgi:hypothetical protein